MSNGLEAKQPLMPNFELIFREIPGLYLVLSPTLHIVAVSNRYVEATLTVREEILGRHIFDVFPDAPEMDSTGVRNLRSSLEYVIQNRVADTMAVQKYPIRTSSAPDAPFELRYWSPTNSPVLEPVSQQLLYIIHRVEDVTEYVVNNEKVAGVPRPSSLLSSEAHVEAEIYVRAQEIQEANRKLKNANAELNCLHELLAAKCEEREVALNSSDERFRLLVNGVKEYAIFMLNSKGVITSWNQGAERIYGFKESEVLGQGYATFFCEEDRLAETPERELAAASRDGSVDEQGWRFRKDGTRFWSNGVLTALYDSNGQIRGFAKISRDWTKNRSAETLLQSIVDTAIDGIITINERGLIQTFNRAAERIFGYSATEVIGKNVKLLMPEPFLSQHDQYIANYQRTGCAKIIGIGREVEGKRKNGEQFPIDLAISEFDQEGRRGFTGLVRDISARKNLERQYHHAQKMDAIGKLAGGIAHDFNNLLTVILGYSELLQMDLAPQSGHREIVDEIYHAGTKAALLTRQLLTFSRQQSNQPVIVDLNTIVQESCRMLKRLIGEDVKLVTLFATEPTYIRADPIQLEQVILNLSINARDAMPGGGVLTIETRIETVWKDSEPENLKAGSYVVLEVHDTGEGIDPKIQAEIFEPFFTTKSVGKGTGLGLAVVDGIVSQSNGFIQLKSAVGVGTTFQIFFPSEKEKHDERLPNAPPASTHGSASILLVEDDPAVRELTFRALISFGYNVTKADGVPDAIQIIKQPKQRFDLILTDVVMPESSGFELVEELRSVQPNAKWLLMSGYTDDVVARKYDFAFDAIKLQKPYTLEALCVAVRHAIEE